MYKVEVFKNGTIAFGSKFETESQARTWAKEQEKRGSWGEPEEYEVKIINDADHDRRQKIKLLKEKRDRILCATDWIFLPDVKFDQKHRRMYMEYRQLLRDVPQRLREHKPVTFEEFEHWLRRNHPEEFKDGGNGQKIIYRFNYYIKE